MRCEPVSGVRLSESPAVEAFLSDFGKVETVYEYDWTKQESFAKRAAYLQGGGYQGDRKAVVAALTNYNQNLGAGEATLANLRLLAEDSTLTVVTGQQGAIFTGPAYAIYKGMTAVWLARQQSTRLGVPVVPIFWVAGEDHDWPEHVSVLVSSGDDTKRVALKESFDGVKSSVGLAPSPASLTEVIAEFEALLPDTEFKADVMARIRQGAEATPALDPALTNGQPTLADWFARLITWLFADTGLILINSADPALRQIEAPFFQRVIEAHGAVDAAFGKGHEDYRALGFEPTVDRQPGNLNLFTYVNGDRLPLLGDGERFWVRDRTELVWSKQALLDLAASHPERFSTNVVLRPVVQGLLLPDLAYVGGPGEISYFGLYRAVFAALGQQMPIVYPRASFTLIEPPIARILEKRSMTVADVFFHMGERRKELLEREDRLGLTSLFEQFREQFGAQYDGIVTQLLQLDGGLKLVAEENRKQIAVQINKLEEKARQQHRKNCEVALKQFDRLKAQLLPTNGLQERSVSLLPFMAKYGPSVIADLLALSPLEHEWQHYALFLGA
jgi:bacillithiol biosynthesis cysteine-adding enzyme BshC